ncbi:MAG: RsmE family RNA methyltransferase [Chlamydiota bacterium]
MPDQRFYVPLSFQVDATFEIKEDEFRHLIKVMRNDVGDTIELINGKGDLAKGVIENVLSKAAQIRVTSVQTMVPKKYSMILIQAMAKKSHMDYILEKATELGVDHFYLFPSQHSEKDSYSPSQIERMEHLIIAASKQCGRLTFPKIHIFPSLQKMENLPTICFFGDVRKEAPPFLDKLNELNLNNSFGFFIGPESGFTAKEVEYIESKYRGNGVSLHENILRVETASIAALAILSHRLGIG